MITFTDTQQLERLEYHVKRLLEYVQEIFPHEMEKLMLDAGEKVSILRDLASVKEYVPIMLKHVEELPRETDEQEKTWNILIEYMKKDTEHLKMRYIKHMWNAYNVCIKEGVAGADEVLACEEVLMSMQIYDMMDCGIKGIVRRERALKSLEARLRGITIECPIETPKPRSEPVEEKPHHAKAREAFEAAKRGPIVEKE